MKAQSYGKYDIIDDEQATTWEQAEALAMRARGNNVAFPKAPPAPKEVKREKQTAPPPAPEELKKLFEKIEDVSLERHLLNRALILLIHLRERVYKDDPQVEAWVNEILDGVRQGKRI